MKSLLLLLTFLCLGAYLINATTPLEDWVLKKDDSYRWSRTPEHDFNSTVIPGDASTGYSVKVINMTSQTWLPGQWARGAQGTAGWNERSGEWWHMLYIVIPDSVDPSVADWSFMYMSGGDNDGHVEDAKGEDIFVVAYESVATGTIGAVLLQIPNQPIYFLDETPTPQHRTEDAVIAWTWQHYINDPSDPTWLLRLPMTKAGVRAMDTITAFLKQERGHGPSKFIVAGASKRGWTTWTVGGVASKSGVLGGPVEAIVPIVLDELHLVDNIKYQFRAYNGQWSFALKDYYALNFTQELDNPNTQKMMDIVGPLAYTKQMEILPKLAIVASGDEFQRPDATRIWWHDLTGESHLRVMENCEHSLAENVLGVLSTVESFALGVIHNVARPSIDWSFSTQDGSITAVLNDNNQAPPTSVKAWFANTIDGNQMRDFRLVNCPKCSSGGSPGVNPVLWFSYDLKPQPDNKTYVARPTAPSEGWQGLFIEFFFPGPKSFNPQEGSTQFKMSTGVSIWPNTYPAQTCHGSECRGNLC